MTRTSARQRRPVSRVTLALLSPLFRYSLTRDAYVLRGVGNQHGPVLQQRRAELPVLPAPASSGASRPETGHHHPVA